MEPIKYMERNFIISSIIRLLSEIDFTEKNTEVMLKTSKSVKEILENGGTITDEEILHQYVKNMEET